jgi:hypothetical protein
MTMDGLQRGKALGKSMEVYTWDKETGEGMILS